MELKIKLLGDAVLPEYAHDGDSGFDLRAAEDYIIYPGWTTKMETNCFFGIPEGYELQVRPRSGVSSKTKLRVQFGTVDQPYNGEVMVTIDNIAQREYKIVGQSISELRLVELVTQLINRIDGKKETHKEFVPVGSYIVKKGERIAQLVMAKVEKVELKKVDELEETVRGDNGHGSSGIN